MTLPLPWIDKKRGAYVSLVRPIKLKVPSDALTGSSSSIRSMLNKEIILFNAARQEFLHRLWKNNSHAAGAAGECRLLAGILFLIVVSRCVVAGQLFGIAAGLLGGGLARAAGRSA